MMKLENEWCFVVSLVKIPVKLCHYISKYSLFFFKEWKNVVSNYNCTFQVFPVLINKIKFPHETMCKKLHCTGTQMTRCYKIDGDVFFKHKVAP